MTTIQAQSSTPPASTVSTPSPTELQDQNPLEAEATRRMLSRSASSKPIYLIVATTRCTYQGQAKLGIGLRGSLPWPMVKADMAYFRKVTTEGNSKLSSSRPSGHSNSVVMGRKTYESIPPKFRPLSGRTNIIVTRTNPSDLAGEIVQQLKKSAERSQDLDVSTQSTQEMVVITATHNDTALPKIVVTNSIEAAVEVESAEIYCIGGSEIYNLFLRNEILRPRLRILQTVLQKLKDGEEFECDTFWSEPLHEGSSAWKEVGTEEVVSWTGIDVPQGSADSFTDEKVGVRLRVVGWQSNET